MKNKKCSTCKEEKRITEFNKNKSRKDGHEYDCRLCKKKRASKYYDKNKKYLLACKALYYQNNKEVISTREKEYNKKKIECSVCESVVTRNSLSRHQRTKKCMECIKTVDDEDI